MSAIKYRASANDSWQNLVVVVGPQGPAGETGATGAQGPAGANGTNGTNGADGVGIASIVMNNDYTLTITLTNNQSYTTSSIRGPQGETGATGATGPQGPTGPAGTYTAGTGITISNGEISGFSGSYNDLSDKPTIPSYSAGTGISITNGVISLDLTNANGVSY